jgi:hypothetical protein
MVVKKINTGNRAIIKSIQPMGEIKNESLKKIKIGYTMESETRYISPVAIKM